MKTMTWEEIDKDWSGLQKRQRMEIAEAVARYCIGHTIREVAEHLERPQGWVQQHLDYAGVGVSLGGTTARSPSEATRDDIQRIVRDFAPDVTVKLVDNGKGHQTIEEIAGADAKAFEPYVEHYIQQGHEPSVAVRLAKSEWAGEAAVEQGVIKETTNKQNQKVNQILFPQDEKDSFVLDFRMHMARVKAAARFLNEAKMNRLRSRETREGVASADEEWRFQVDRIVGELNTQRKD